MSQVTFKGKMIELEGTLPKVGGSFPSFTLVDKELNECSSEMFKGKLLLLNIFPSLDTSVCANSVRSFYQKLGALKQVTLLNISMDLPFAAGRFCSAESIPDAHTLSAFRSTFGKDYGLKIATGPLKGLLARAVFLIDSSGKIIYQELVQEITREPNYETAVEAIQQLLPA